MFKTLKKQVRKERRPGLLQVTPVVSRNSLLHTLQSPRANWNTKLVLITCAPRARQWHPRLSGQSLLKKHNFLSQKDAGSPAGSYCQREKNQTRTAWTALLQTGHYLATALTFTMNRKDLNYVWQRRSRRMEKDLEVGTRANTNDSEKTHGCPGNSQSPTISTLTTEWTPNVHGTTGLQGHHVPGEHTKIKTTALCSCTQKDFKKSNSKG